MGYRESDVLGLNDAASAGIAMPQQLYQAGWALRAGNLAWANESAADVAAKVKSAYFAGSLDGLGQPCDHDTARDIISRSSVDGRVQMAIFNYLLNGGRIESF